MQVIKRGNVIIKLDMVKTYDKMSWNFLFATMRKFGLAKNGLILNVGL